MLLYCRVARHWRKVTMRRSRTSLHAIVSFSLTLGLGALLASASPAFGQDALGGGNVLDNNLDATGSRINPVAPQPDYRARNLIVTGDVAGGRGFRGSVGYTAAEDFRGSLGSNDLFQFRADSAYSSPSLVRLGATYEQLRFGEQLAALPYRRTGTGTTYGTIDSISIMPEEGPAAGVRLDRQILSTTVMSG